jgi:hypothetical protein
MSPKEINVWLSELQRVERNGANWVLVSSKDYDRDANGKRKANR